MVAVADTFQGASGRRVFKALLNSLLPFLPGEAPGNTREEIDEYCWNLQKNIDARHYEPAPPRGEMSLAKMNGVPRFITFPTFRDQCIFHHCISQLEASDQFIHRVSNTFGGWHLPHPHRKQEAADMNRLANSISEKHPASPYADSAVNPTRYRRMWKEYGYNVYLHTMEFEGYAAVHIDIANFYDSIDLHSLERMIRARAVPDVKPIVDLLFHYLRNYDRRRLGYSPRTVGLPHEELTETSRVLSNLYLVEYDQIMTELCLDRQLQFSYMRYSDDQFFFVPDVSSIPSVIHKAGKELHNLGLNINASKVMIFDSTEDVDEYWKFSIYSQSEAFVEHGDASELCRYYLHRKTSNPSDRWRDDLMRNAIIQSLMRPWQDWEARRDFIDLILGNPSELYGLTDFHWSRIYSVSNTDQRARLLSHLSAAILSGYPFSKFHLHVVKFLKAKGISPDVSGLSEELLDSLVNSCRL